MRKTVLKKLSAAGLLLGIGLLAVATGMTKAYFSHMVPKINPVDVGENTTHITEEFPPVTPSPIPQNPVYPKKVQVRNPYTPSHEQNVDCFVRVRLGYSNGDIGRGVELQGLDQVNWIYDPLDGYYYYKPVLRAGESTTPLFQGFRILASKVDDLYKDQIPDFSIFVYEESVQAKGFADYAQAWNYYLRPVTEEERSVP